MPVRGFDYPDLGGGRNADSAPTQLQSKEFQELRNFYAWQTRLRRRGGTRRVTTVGAWNQQITSMFPFSDASGNWHLIAGGQSGFGRLSAGTIADLSAATGLAVPTGNYPWVFLQYKNYLYAMRKGDGKLYRLTSTTVNRAGIEAPTVAPTLVDGGAGTLSAGVYRGVYTYGNIETGIESNPSPEGNVTLGASKKIDWSTISASSNSFVNKRSLYRSIPDQVGVYFLVDEILNNTSTVYTGDSVSVADLGFTASFDNGLPFPGLIAGEIWNERLFATDGVNVYFSEPLMIEAFGDESTIPVYPNDGHQVRALRSYGDRLIIGKTNKVHYLVGTGSSTSAFGLYVLEDKHGCMSHHSMQTAENQLFWYGSGKAVFWSDGSSVRDISTPRISDILQAIPDALEEFVIGATFPQLSWYVLSVPTPGQTTNRKVLVYDYKRGSWSVFDHPSDAPQFISDFFDENYGHLLYATFYDGHLYEYNDEDYPTDFGTQISASFTTKADDFGIPAYRKSMAEIWLLTDRVSGDHSLQLEVIGDEGDVIANRSVSLDIAGHDWKPYRLSTHTKPSTRMQTRATYVGNDAIDIDQLHFEVGLFPRKPGQPR